MRNLTSLELRETNGGTDIAFAIVAAAAEIQRQLDAIENLSNLTGTSADFH